MQIVEALEHHQQTLAHHNLQHLQVLQCLLNPAQVLLSLQELDLLELLNPQEPKLQEAQVPQLNLKLLAQDKQAKSLQAIKE